MKSCSPLCGNNYPRLSYIYELIKLRLPAKIAELMLTAILLTSTKWPRLVLVQNVK